MTEDKLLRLRNVEEITGLQHSALYKLIAAGRFPLPIKIGRASRWKASEIQRWINGLSAARSGAGDGNAGTAA